MTIEAFYAAVGGDYQATLRRLMVIGMLTVYVFLLIMIFCMNLMAKILAPLAAKFEKPQEKPAAARNDDDALRAAAAAAAFNANSK